MTSVSSGIITIVAGVPGTCGYNGDNNLAMKQANSDLWIPGSRSLLHRVRHHFVRELNPGQGTIYTIVGGRDPQTLTNEGDKPKLY